MSLRARLVLGLLALAAVGLVVADIATYASLRSFLVDRLDATLQSDHIAVENALGRSLGGGGCGLDGGVDREVFVQVRTTSGRIVCTRSASEPPSRPPGSRSGDAFDRGRPDYPPSALPPPKLSSAQTFAPASAGERPRYFDTTAVSGGTSYRVRVAYEPEIPAVLIVATSRSEVVRTLHRLLLIELLVTAAVLLAIALLSLWVVRLGLKPLDHIEETAAGIGAGDLSKRIEHADQRTEIGRLGLALNAMLGQIESAFHARSESERKLRRFVADASHELRTPLAAVRAYAELFERGADQRPEDLARAMTGIERESERMSALVEDLLLLARLDEGRPLEREPVELDRVVTEAVETAVTVDPDRPIELNTQPVEVVGDRQRLRQSIDNLLSNVRAHTPPAAPVRVSLERRNGSAVIEVADSGPGMTPEEAEHVFERFYRADASRSRASGGVGLGLSIVAAVAKAHGGAVSASAEPGKGAAFRITLPLGDQTGDGDRAG